MSEAPFRYSTLAQNIRLGWKDLLGTSTPTWLAQSKPNLIFFSSFKSNKTTHYESDYITLFIIVMETRGSLWFEMSG